MNKNSVIPFLLFCSTLSFGQSSLARLRCYINQLSHLDVSENTAMTNLNCDDNQLSHLDVSKNTALTRLQCDSNQLTELDVSKNTTLKDSRIIVDKSVKIPR
jgi:Leucine-rich repeat (LRR) protein